MPDERTFFYKNWIDLSRTIQSKTIRLALYDAILDYAFAGKETTFQSQLATEIYKMAKAKINATNNRSNGHRNLKIISSKSQDNLEIISSKKQEKEKVSSPSSPIFKNQEKKEGFNACAHTDAYALESESQTDLEEFASLMPEHLRYSESFRESWREWLDYRKKTRKKVSHFAASRQLSLLGEYEPFDASRIIETSIQNDWQGLFPAKSKDIQPKKDYTGL